MELRYTSKNRQSLKGSPWRSCLLGVIREVHDDDIVDIKEHDDAIRAQYFDKFSWTATSLFDRSE
ncbi:hypothetical protein N7447_001450 [Penicillium robsamsonii]|uniref:uncharacterized protein n=1 Tax=Penicillium robsamsonii TaxID=1792511 RepID=UPI0025492780|nr:uncharacterized protein N7447_001450 [Penicillium robsamsonii]KAJ5835424.1 hypothetical protein N7447_001450 [Penicillium robsamsonii]